MEAQAVFGRGSPCLPSSLLRSPTQRTCCSLSYTHCPILRTTHHLHLAAFHSKSHLFSYSPSNPHAKTLSHTTSTTKTHIFLPHLVASMVCFSLSLSLCVFLFNFLPQLSKTHLSFLSFSSVFAKFIRTPFENFVLFFIFCFGVIVCAGTS